MLTKIYARALAKKAAAEVACAEWEAQLLNGCKSEPRLYLCDSAQKYKFQIDGVFLWSTGSWDVLAVYPESTAQDGSYFDPVVAGIIETHNRAAKAAGHEFMAPTRAVR